MHIYNDEIYISDFIARTSGQPIIWQNKGDYKKVERRVKNRYVFKHRLKPYLICLLIIEIIIMLLESFI